MTQWSQINPKLNIGKLNFQSPNPILFSQYELTQINESLLDEGYFALDPKDFQLPIDEMANAISQLKSRNMMPVYAFVYDEFWMLFFKLHNLLCSILGNDYKILPAFWAWHIDPSAEEYGWNPHRDRNRLTLDAEGNPKTLTLWIPLTESTPLNGCMYVVPSNRDPSFNNDDRSLRFSYQDIRALPAESGSILGWTQETLHWGSHSSKKAKTPRISLSVEFQRGDVEAFETPFITPLTDLNFMQRIMLINHQINKYQNSHLSKH